MSCTCTCRGGDRYCGRQCHLAGSSCHVARKARLRLVGPEKKKKTTKALEAEKKALDLREKKMTRREFIQYLYEEKLKEELENAPLKRLVLKD